MKYLCLIFTDEKELAARLKSESDTLVNEHLDYDDELGRSGHFIVAEALQPPEAATTLRVRNGKVSITGGPFVGTKEQLCGFFLIEARDLNEAIQIASRIPSARRGSVEVRPTQELRRH